MRSATHQRAILATKSRRDRDSPQWIYGAVNFVPRDGTQSIPFVGKYQSCHGAQNADPSTGAGPTIPSAARHAVSPNRLLAQSRKLTSTGAWCRRPTVTIAAKLAGGVLRSPPSWRMRSHAIVTQVLDPIDIVASFGDDPGVDEVDVRVRAAMQSALDRLVCERRLPILGRHDGETEPGRSVGRPCSAEHAAGARLLGPIPIAAHSHNEIRTQRR